MRKLFLLAVSAALIAGCSDNEGELVERAPSTPGAESPQDVAMNTGSGQLPPDHPPMSGGPMGNNPMMNPNTALMPGPKSEVKLEGQKVTIGPLSFEIGSSWQSTPPSSSMRVAQFSIPAAEGDPEPAELAIFQGIGGSADQNIERWIGQFQSPDGAEPVRQEQTVNGLIVKTLNVKGTYTGAMGGPMSGGMGQVGGGGPKPNSQMLAAVVEGPGGPWHFKFVGPEKTVAAHQAEFDKLISSLTPVQQ